MNILYYRQTNEKKAYTWFIYWHKAYSITAKQRQIVRSKNLIPYTILYSKKFLALLLYY